MTPYESLILTELSTPEGRALKTAFRGALAFGTDIGLTRDENQDRLIVLRTTNSGSMPNTLYAAVADGMGGMADGSACAQLALASFADYLINNPGEPLGARLEHAALHSDQRVHSRFGGRGGATLSAVAVPAEGISLALQLRS